MRGIRPTYQEAELYKKADLLHCLTEEWTKIPSVLVDSMPSRCAAVIHSKVCYEISRTTYQKDFVC